MMKFVKKIFWTIIICIVILSVLWGLATRDLHRGANLYTTMVSKIFTPIITYVFEKKVERTTKKLEAATEVYVESLNNR